MTDVLALAQQLVRIDTSAGGERAAAEMCRAVLAEAGARTELVEMAPGRTHLVAHVGDTSRAPLVLSGHLDTVPADASTWTEDPWIGAIRDGMLLGRGSTDMKGGVAALVAAVARYAAAADHGRGVLLVLTAAEETGCEGARHLLGALKLPGGGPLLVAEPTNLALALGHKGVLWLRASARGRSAHGSRPDLGQSAIAPLARLVTALEEQGLPGEHPDMGRVSANVGIFHGGTQINLVPDTAFAEIDIRVVAGVDPVALRDHVARLAGPRITIETMQDLAPVYTPSDEPFVHIVAEALTRVRGDAPRRQPLTYFTDAAVLGAALHSEAVVLLGPGDPDAAHTTDEQCPAADIEDAAQVYGRILETWAAEA